MIRLAAVEDAHTIHQINAIGFLKNTRYHEVPSSALNETVRSSIEEALKNGSENALLFIFFGRSTGWFR